ncbi:carotenoid 1,2-hydratase [Hydrogenophaga sp.]|uniref:carotenoid 1,2-hydratase n=1 Tax=Hydrogenophaga sp. TaxID=1904254 RepID=UPI002725F4A7|nr:carotenoid 1,2-hydratase [Hydrogenophaga sp.]MDO8906730.1 carotenoid 1,2-hydratase [Hydrogenophaga sp.]
MPAGGYLWWYIDALSDDGAFGLSIIAFVGSVFSPYYAWARRGTPKHPINPDNHCALNVALYSAGAKRWSMTERGASHNHRNRHHFQIGPSELVWHNDALTIHIDEVCAPLPRRIRGTVTLHPSQLFNFSTPLDATGRHRWGPLGPHARVEVNLQHPAQKWQGHGYLDSNEGDEPVERAFTEWDWSRSQMKDGSTAVIYDVEPGKATGTLLALRFGTDGHVKPFEAPPLQGLPRTAWRLQRRMRSDAPVCMVQQLEDTPFYQRAILQSSLLGEQVTSFHETLHVPRLVSPMVQGMLPWRMPRRA